MATTRFDPTIARYTEPIGFQPLTDTEIEAQAWRAAMLYVFDHWPPEKQQQFMAVMWNPELMRQGVYRGAWAPK
jgi:hypothetical protein